MKKAYTYDSLDRVKEMTYTDLETGKVMESYHYSYDKNSNITEKTEVNNYPKEEKDKVNETKAYTYDALGRLTKTVTTDHKNDDKTKTAILIIVPAVLWHGTMRDALTTKDLSG